VKYNPDIHHRRSIRLKGCDYSRPGAYFITICTQNRECLFGKVAAGKMRLNALGRIVWEEWFRTAEIRPYVRLNEYEFVVMPNHVHGIIWSEDPPANYADTVGSRRRRAPTMVEQFGKPVRGSIPTIVRAFKSAVTKRINQMRNTPGAPVWQRNYYEHIVRDENELNRIREYINNNPLNWAMDQDNPNVRTTDRSPQQQDESWRI
jgi:REP element-mobilizing transposase RayT